MASRFLPAFCLALASAASTAQDLPGVPEGYTVRIFADGLLRPLGLSFDPAGNLLVCSWDGGTVHSIAPDGGKTLLNHGMLLEHATQPVATPDGRVFVTASGSSPGAKIWEIVAGSPVLFLEGAAGLDEMGNRSLCKGPRRGRPTERRTGFP